LASSRSCCGSASRAASEDRSWAEPSRSLSHSTVSPLFAYALDRTVSEQVISVTPERVVFDGRLGKLRQHSHAVLALLVGVERPFRLVTAEGVSACAVAVVPAAVLHELDFHGRRTLVVYVEPHASDYAAFHRGAAGRCPQRDHLNAAWQGALATWSSAQDARALLAVARAEFGDEHARLDPRVSRLATCFSRGELLDAPLASMASRLRLSSSRLVHLLTDELGVGVRRLKQHYRFKQVALGAASGENLTTAALAAGFADSGHFSRTFAETFGLSPSQVLLR
jgi:AraC-like DNA-binding protein